VSALSGLTNRIDMSERVCVYDIVLNGEVVYVGQTKNPDVRIDRHRKNKRFPHGVKLIVHKWYQSRHDAMIAEGVRQRELLPCFCNKIEGGAPCPRNPTRPRANIDLEKYRKQADHFNATYTNEDMVQMTKEIAERQEDARRLETQLKQGL